MKEKKSLWKSFLSLNGSGVFLALIAFIIIVAIISPMRGGGQFITLSNLVTILRQQTYIGIIACGVTLIIITGNIDLSIGSMLTFLACACASFMMEGNWVVAVLATIGIGALCGLINGIFVAGLRLNAFITTLGTGSIFGALALIISQGRVLIPPNNSSFEFIGKGSLFGVIPMPVFFLVLVVVILGFVLSKTVYGQRLYAIGANPVAARFSGVRARRDTVITYVITGVLVGLAAVIMISNVMSANPQVGQSKEMDIILAVVLGGTSILGGKGSVWGTVIGFLFTGVLSSGFTFLNVPTYIQWIIMGVILVFALSSDIIRERGIKLWKRKS